MIKIYPRIGDITQNLILSILKYLESSETHFKLLRESFDIHFDVPRRYYHPFWST